MTLPVTNRYIEFLSYLPRGSMYEANGSVIPFRTIGTDLRLETEDANSRFNVYLNDIYYGAVETDSDGNAVFTSILELGDIEIKLINLTTGRKYSSWVTTREFALWLSAYADVMSDVDEELDRVYQSYFILKANVQDVEDRWGKQIELYNDTGMSLADYQRQLHELRGGYRSFGGTYLGLDHAVADFTQVPPFGFARRAWGPNWILDQSMLQNHRFTERSHEIGWSSTGIEGVTLARAEAGVPGGSSASNSVSVDFVDGKPVVWFTSGGGVGPQVWAREGEVFLPGEKISTLGSVYILGLPDTFSIVASVNDRLYLDFDRSGIVVVTLTTGLPTPTAANIVTDINAACTGTPASVYDDRVLLTAAFEICILSGARQAALDVFGQLPGSLVYPARLREGVDLSGLVLKGSLGVGTLIWDTTGAVATVEWFGPGGRGGGVIAAARGGSFNTRTLKSRDEGLTWTRYTNAGYGGASVDIASAKGVTLLGRWGNSLNQYLTLRSTDYGETWDSVHPSVHGYARYAYGDGVWLSGYAHRSSVGNNKVIRSSDMGLTWEELGPFSGQGAGSLIAFGNGVFIRVRKGGSDANTNRVQRSTDKGETWSEVYNVGGGQFGPNLGSIAYSDGVWVLGGSHWYHTGPTGYFAGYFAYSTDDGVSWTEVQKVYNGAHWGGLAGGNGRFIALHTTGTSSSRIRPLYSTDGGATWTLGGAIPSGIANVATTDIVWIKDDVFIIAAWSSGKMLRTTDGGLSWTEITVPNDAWATICNAESADATKIPRPGAYQLVDALGSTIEVAVDPARLPQGVITTDTFDISYEYSVLGAQAERETQCGIWVQLSYDKLPTAAINAAVTVSDLTVGSVEVAPDNWRVLTSTAALATKLLPSRVRSSLSSIAEGLVSDQFEYGPRSAILWVLEDTATNTLAVVSSVVLTPHSPPARGSEYPAQGSSLFYDYEGFSATFSSWVKYVYGSSGTATATCSFSWDGGSTWHDGSAKALLADESGHALEPWDYVEYVATIPATLVDNKVWVKLTFNKSDTTGDFNIWIDSPNVQIDTISSGFLADTTIVRNRHRQYFGELAYVWSPDVLSLKEQEYIGLRHKRPSKRSPFSGVEITEVSYDVAAGSGSFEHLYNPVTQMHSLRWSSFSSVWSAGAGWQEILADGNYQVVSPDGSYITVTVIYSSLPVFSGTTIVEKSTVIKITDTSINQGHARKILPAHSSLDIFDVTEYDAEGIPLNLRGAVSEGDFTACERVNLSIQTSTPFRYSYLVPTSASAVGESLVVNAASYIAVLDLVSDQDQSKAILYINGTPLYNIDPSTGVWAWRFVSSTEIEIQPSYFDATAKYTIDYELLYQVQTPVFDLGAAYEDYAWWADYFVWDRFDANQGSYAAEVPLTFNADTGLAYLDQASNKDYSTAKLMSYDANGAREVPQTKWRFTDAKTVYMNLSQYVADAQYVLHHEENRVYQQSRLSVVLEQRSGSSYANCIAASWSEKKRNENVEVLGSLRYHQMRLRVSGLRSVLDFKVRSLVLKGLHLYGSGASVPGLIN